MSSRILVVEDEKQIADGIRRTLTKLGYDVLEPIASGVAAIRVAEEQRPGLVVMDVQLAGTMDGIEAGTVIHERLRIPVLFLTSQSDEPTLARAVEAQPQGYLLRPFTDRELRTAVRFALRKHELESKLAAQEANLRRSEQLYRSLARHLPGVSVVLFDADLRVVLAEGGVVQNAARGSLLRDSVPPEVRVLREMQWQAALDGSTSTYETEEGGRSQRVSVVPVGDDDGTVFAGMLVSHDITEDKRRAAQLEARSITDELTGLYNRRGFLRLAEQHAHLALRNKQPFAIMFADLNGLKSINDKLGHEMGDQAIREAAVVLKQSMRDADIVARFGGDEFAILLDGCTTEVIGTVVNRLRRELERVCFAEDRNYRVSLSTGTAFWDPALPQSIDDLLAEADRRMYHHKRERPSINMPVVRDSPVSAVHRVSGPSQEGPSNVSTTTETLPTATTPARKTKFLR